MNSENPIDNQQSKPNTESIKQSTRPKPEIPSIAAQSQATQSPHSYKITCDKRRDWIDKATLGMEGLGLFIVVVYTIATVIYACITNNMWKEMQEQTRLQRKTAINSQRAWVGLDRFNIGEDHPGQDVPLVPVIGPNVPIAGNFFLKNYGKTPARIDDVALKLEVRSDPVPEDFYYGPPKPGLVLFPGTNFETSSTGDVRISEVDFRQLKPPGSKHLTLHGIVRYHDTFGNHWTKLCLVWTTQFNFFSNCLEHNGADEEKQ